ncbi:MAG: HAMP domain-containing sensor histidine kinase [Lachnospiraceae bacterium]|nr:HAMP domain-containing sensor histidine kinase [Lachnospiraceae bacterium]
MNHNHSISTEFLKLLAAAALCACVLFGTERAVSVYIVQHYFESDAYVKKRNEKQIEELVRYVEKKNVSVGEKEKLTKWLKNHPLITIQVFKDGMLQYDSAYPDLEDTWSVDPDDYYGWQTYYSVQFADGSADVFISGYYGYRFSMISMVIGILLSGLLFLVIVLFGIRKTIRYILRLSREIEILESGDLDYEITVSGKNELSELAKGLNSMRTSLKERMESESRVTREHARLITEMSHDLRTPLTAVLVYVEILKKLAYRDEKQLQQYIEKIEAKGIQMKQRTDNLFEYALIGSEMKNEVGRETVGDAFYERISDLCAYLSDKQFDLQVDLDSSLNGRLLNVNTEYLDRIFDNIVSNIVKYGDCAEPVRVSSTQAEHRIQFAFENRITEKEKHDDSNYIGLKNIENMMRSMGGESEAKTEEERFRIVLRFPEVS